MVAINVLWKVLVGFGIAGLGLASVLYGGQLSLDSEKLDKEVFVQYREQHTEDTKEYRRENNEAHKLIGSAISEIQVDVREIMTILKEREDK